MSKFEDFLVYYNNLDVGPFVEAVMKMQQFYFDKHIDVFKNTVSVPGIARNLLFRTSKDNNASFALFGHQHKDLYDTTRKGIVGGPSIIFNRYSKVGETCIRSSDKVCQNIVGYDANALYLWSLGEDMPVGSFIRRLEKDQFKPVKSEHLEAMYHWMDWVMTKENIHIDHRRNYGKEVKVGKYYLDGYCSSSRLAFEFQGCFYHGHNCSKMQKQRQKKGEEWWDGQREKFNKTKQKISDLKKMGYKVIEMWECEFNKLKRTDPELRDFVNRQETPFYSKFKWTVTPNRILDAVKSGLLFGMIEVDIEVPDVWPDHLKNVNSKSPREYFSEMSPIFCNTDIPFENIGEHMQAHVHANNLSQKSRRLLVGGMKAEKILLATPLLQSYLNHGLKVTRVYQVVEYKKQKCFKDFRDRVSDARRRGDHDPDLEVEAATMKLIGNSGYGSLIMDQTKHQNIKYCQSQHEASLMVNSPHFRKLTELPKDIFEMEMSKKTIQLNLPIQLGFFILQYAKLRMLEFYYDFVDFYIDRSDFMYLEMDTDSAYFAISSVELDNIIRPGLKQHFYSNLYKWMPSEHCQNHLHDFVTSKLNKSAFHQHQCCKQRETYDKRTPGLFKLEATGDEMICLCSKTYILVNKGATKFSCKGINKNRVCNAHSIFSNVLKTKESHSVINRGFRVKDNQIFTYEQARAGFGYFYCKRKLLNDGIQTEPLDITLCPN